jgi:hypothetical protein
MRGQALVLFALLLLVLTLLVLFTIDIGLRAREHVELQLTSDVAAYNQAVMTARVYNGASIRNRASYAMVASAAGAQSMVSWAGHMRSNLQGLEDALNDLKDQYSADAGCASGEDAIVDSAISLIDTEQLRIQTGWDAKDQEAALDVLKWIGNAGGTSRYTMKTVGGGHLQDLMCDHIVDANSTRAVAQKVNPELAVRPLSAQKSMDELTSYHCNGTIVPFDRCDRPRVTPDFVLCEIGGGAVLEASMGVRDGFASARAGGQTLMKDWLEQLLDPVNRSAVVTPAAQEGGSGFRYADRHAAQGVTGMGTDGFWGEDHGGRLTVEWQPVLGCGVKFGTGDVIDSYVKATDSTLDDEHVFSPGGDNGGGLTWHDFGPCNICPLMFPAFFDFNPMAVTDANNDFGQPKLYSMVERDYAARASRHPWEFFFNFQFAASSPGVSYGNRPLQYPLQVASSAGIVYYHRPDAWNEPPNVMNPFWRATLTAPDQDLADRYTQAGYANQAAMVTALQAAGYRGGAYP